MSDRSEQQFAQAATLLDIGTPAEELQRLVQARMETLARLDEGDEAQRAARLDAHAEALRLGLAQLREAGS